MGQTGATERDDVTRVSPEFFSTLGINLAMGRAFSEKETTFQTDGVVILTDAYWRQHFSADPQVLGKELRVDGLPKIVIGVLPADFSFLSSHARLYFPLSSSPEDRTPTQRHSGGNSIQMIARLKPNATLAQAQAQIDTQNATLELDDPDAKVMANAGFRSLVVPLRGDHVASIRPTLLLMQAGALSLLLIGVVNLANLLLVRASGRAKELAVRQALGASRLHIASEGMIETSILTLLGGLLGIAVGAGGIRLLVALGSDRLPLGSQVALDMRLALAALVGTVITGIVLGVPIVWVNFKSHRALALQSESRMGTAGRAAQHLRHCFIVGQVGLAVVLLSAAGLLGRSLEHAIAISPGFRPDHILTGQISLPGRDYRNTQSRMSFNERLMKEIGRQPGVSATGVVTNVPFSGRSGKSAATVKGYVPRPGESPRGHYSYGVDGDYFRAMGFRLLEGRFLTAADSRTLNRVCLVDQDFARYYFPHSSALGQRLFQGVQAGKNAEGFTIAGVVSAAKQAGLTEDTAQGAVYYPYVFRGDDRIFVVVRTGLPPESLGRTLQNSVRHIDPDLPVNDLRSMDARIADSLITRRSPAVLAGLFSLVAVLLTSIGTYGVLSFAVTQRRREIGVRMALGARPALIRRQFLSLALRLLAAGTLAGVIGAWIVGHAMQAVLFHVPAFDLVTLAGAAGTVGVVTLVACLVPSHRAARISPLEALADQ